MENQPKSKTPLLIGIAIPLLLIVFVFLIDYLLPDIFIKPQYDFVYAAGHEVRYLDVQKGRAEIPPCPYKEAEGWSCLAYPNIDFYFYDMTAEENIPISQEELNSYTLDVSEKSPDGYAIYQGERGGGFFPFFWTSESGNVFRLAKGNFLAKKIILKGEYYNFKFIGWVLNE